MYGTFNRVYRVNWYSSMKKIEKDLDNFWHGKLTLNVRKWQFVSDTSPLHQFAKFNSFLWVCWFLAKNLFNFVSLPWKLYNWYCHICQGRFTRVYCQKVQESHVKSSFIYLSPKLPINFNNKKTAWNYGHLKSI